MKELNKKDVQSFGYKFGYICGLLLIGSLVTAIAILLIGAAILTLVRLF